MKFREDPPSVATTAGSGIVSSGQPSTSRQIASFPFENQTRFVGRRFGLTPHRARLIAGLAFPGAAR